MARGVLVATLFVLTAAVLWWLLDRNTGNVATPRAHESDGKAPGLIGRGPEEDDDPAALPTIEDPIDYVLSSLGAISPDERRAHLLALIEADPAFLQGLIDWVAAPDDRPLMPPGVVTTDTVEAAIHRVLVLIGEPAVAPLVTLLTEGRRDSRYQATRALRALGPAAGGAVEPLIQVVRAEDEDRHVRAAAIDALGAIGGGSRAVLPFVHTTLRDPDCEEELGLACARNLICIGGASDEAFETCRLVLAEDWYKASAILLKGLESLGPAARPFVPDLLRLFNEPATEEGLWTEVAPVLQAIGDDDDQVLSFLEAMISTSREEAVRDGGAARALAGLGERGQHRLLEIAAPQSDTERLRVLRLLHEEGQGNAHLVGHLAQYLRTADPRYRENALRLLTQLHASAKQVLPVLRPYLNDPSARVRAQALGALGHTTDPSDAALVILEQHAGGNSEHLAVVALSALEGLASTKPDAVLSVYLKALKDQRKRVAWSAAASLGKLVKVRRNQVVRAWLAALEDSRIAKMAARSLRDHASGDLRAQEAFRAIIASPPADLRKYAVQALGKAERPQDFDALLRCVRDADALVRSAALLALRGYASRYGARVLEACVAALEDKHEAPRRSAARALGQLGAQAADALPALEKARRRYEATPHLAYPIQQAIDTINQAVHRR